MAIEIEVFGQLLPGQPRHRALDVEKPISVRDLALAIGLELSEIGLITIDGVQSELEDLAKPDSRLCFFPYLSGG